MLPQGSRHSFLKGEYFVRVLIAEDGPVSLHTLKALISRRDYEVEAVDNGDDAWRILTQKTPPRLAVLDWIMPGKDGIRICREMQERGRDPYIYTILLTAKSDKEDIVRGLNAGADDYLTKPFDPSELIARLRAGKRILDLQDRLEEMATHDSLTGIWNRHAIIHILQGELSRAQRKDAGLAIMMADLDNFKKINDGYGHLAGDAVLCEVARRMRRCIRDYDSVGRFGGEEFLIVAPDCAPDNARIQADRLRTVIVETPVLYEKKEIHASISIGVATVQEIMEFHTDSILSVADVALYKAKENGRNCVEVECV